MFLCKYTRNFILLTFEEKNQLFKKEHAVFKLFMNSQETTGEG